MPTHKHQKQMIRARMKMTGESYVTARMHVVASGGDAVDSAETHPDGGALATSVMAGIAAAMKGMEFDFTTQLAEALRAVKFEVPDFSTRMAEVLEAVKFNIPDYSKQMAEAMNGMKFDVPDFSAQLAEAMKAAKFNVPDYSTQIAEAMKAVKFNVPDYSTQIAEAMKAVKFEVPDFSTRMAGVVKAVKFNVPDYSKQMAEALKAVKFEVPDFSTQMAEAIKAAMFNVPSRLAEAKGSGEETEEVFPPGTRYILRKPCANCGRAFAYGMDKKNVPTGYAGVYCPTCREEEGTTECPRCFGEVLGREDGRFCDSCSEYVDAQ